MCSADGLANLSFTIFDYQWWNNITTNICHIFSRNKYLLS
jgi:hypothetical protein